MQVQFEEEQYNTIRPVKRSPKGLLGLVIKSGIAKTPAQANMVLIGLIVVLMIISYISLNSLKGSGGDDVLDPTLDDPTLTT